MWLESIDNEKTKQIFGPHGDLILSLSKAVAEGNQQSLLLPPELESLQASSEKFGPNGISVALFIESCRNIPWRRKEGEPFPSGFRAKRVVNPYKENVPNESKVWNLALEDAGIREYFRQDTNRNKAESQILKNVWDAASLVGEEIGGHHLRIFLGAASGELAQPDKDFHFFIDHMPWLWLGYWVVGWDDQNNIPFVA